MQKENPFRLEGTLAALEIFYYLIYNLQVAFFKM